MCGLIPKVKSAVEVEAEFTLRVNEIYPSRENKQIQIQFIKSNKKGLINTSAEILHGAKLRHSVKIINYLEGRGFLLLILPLATSSKYVDVVGITNLTAFSTISIVDSFTY